MEVENVRLSFTLQHRSLEGSARSNEDPVVAVHGQPHCWKLDHWKSLPLDWISNCSHDHWFQARCTMSLQVFVEHAGDAILPSSGCPCNMTDNHAFCSRCATSAAKLPLPR